MLTSKPGFTGIAVAVLALGIGANTAIFSLVNAFLLKPLLIQRPEQIVGVYSRDARNPGTFRAFSYPNYLDLRERNPVFTSLTAYNLTMVGLAEGDITRRVFAAVISSNYFATLGVPLWQGRAFTSSRGTARQRHPSGDRELFIVAEIGSRSRPVGKDSADQWADLYGSRNYP